MIDCQDDHDYSRSENRRLQIAIVVIEKRAPPSADPARLGAHVELVWIPPIYEWRRASAIVITGITGMLYYIFAVTTTEVKSAVCPPFGSCFEPRTVRRGRTIVAFSSLHSKTSFLCTHQQTRHCDDDTPFFGDREGLGDGGRQQIS